MIKQATKKSSPTELFNEKQETIFNTPLSDAADAYTKAKQEIEGWKKKLCECEKALIAEMHKAKFGMINLADNKQLRVAVVSMKEKIVLKDLKSKKYRTPRRF